MVLTAISIRLPKKYIDHQLHDVHHLFIDRQEVLDAANAKKGDLKILYLRGAQIFVSGTI